MATRLFSAFELIFFYKQAISEKTKKGLFIELADRQILSFDLAEDSDRLQFPAIGLSKTLGVSVSRGFLRD